MVKKRRSVYKTKNNIQKQFTFGIVISAMLVLITLVVGVMLLIQGIRTFDGGLIFAGGFFAFGAFTFVLGALTVKGCFDKCKVDVLGLYVGILFIAIGGGIITMIYQQEFGFWIIIPVLMVIAGVYQVVKCLKESNFRREK